MRAYKPSFLSRLYALVFGFVFGGLVGFMFSWVVAFAGLSLPFGWVMLVFAVLGAIAMFRLSRNPTPPKL